MAIERESLPELIQSRTVLESKLSRAQAVLENITIPGFSGKGLLRLDTTGDIDRYVDNLDRVTAIQERLVASVIPTFQGEISSLNQTIETLTSAHVERLNALRVRYQRIEGRLGTGLPVPQELLTPITTEIQRLEKFINTGRGGVVSTEPQTPVAPIEPEQPPVVSVEPEFEINGRITSSIDESKFAEPAPEAEKLARVELYVDEQRIVIDGREISFRSLRGLNIQWELFVYLGNSVTRGIKSHHSTDIEDFIKSKNPNIEYSPSSVIGNLKIKIEIDPKNPKIITRSGQTTDSTYQFNADVKIIKKTTEESEEEKKLEALANIAEIQRLINDGVLTSPEQIVKAQGAAGQVGGTIEFQKPAIEPAGVEPAPEDEKKPNLTPELAVSLAGLIQHKAREGIIIKIGDSSIKFSLDDKTSEVFEAIIDRYVPKDQELNGQYSQLRGQALDIVEKIIRNENRDNLIESHEDPDIKFLLTYFCIPDNPGLEEFLIGFLRAEDPDSTPVLDKQLWVNTIPAGIWKPEGAIRPAVQHFVSEATMAEKPAGEVIEGIQAAVEIDAVQEADGEQVTETSLSFRKLSAEELAELDVKGKTEQTPASEPETGITAGSEQKSARRQKPAGPMNTRRFKQFAKSKGFSVVGSAGGDLKVLDPNGNFVCPIPSNRAGGKSIAKGTYHSAIRSINERMESIKEREETSKAGDGGQ